MIRIAILIIVLYISGCQQEDFFPPGLYGYQVERLLASDTLKIWDLKSLRVDGQAQEFLTCADSIDLHFITRGDSTSAYAITCQSDTTYYGNIRATSSTGDESNPLVFTDSIVFEGGTKDLWLVRDITSKVAIFLEFDRDVELEYTFEAQ